MTIRGANIRHASGESTTAEMLFQEIKMHDPRQIPVRLSDAIRLKKESQDPAIQWLVRAAQAAMDYVDSLDRNSPLVRSDQDSLIRAVKGI